MSIESLGNMNNILKGYNSKEWTSDIESGGVELSSLENIKLDSPESRMSFSEMLTKSISDVNGLQKEADTAIQKLVTGESKNIHETMLAVEKADIAFKTMNQIRQKVITAYKEIMRMQL